MARSEEESRRKELTLTQLKYFLTAAAHKSMTGAAAELYIAQSAISTAVAQLERTLGVTLFIRQPSKGLALTSSGEQLLRDGRSLLAQLEELTESIRAHDQQVEGVLRLACFVTLGPFILPQLISEIGRKHPNLHIEVFESDFEETAQMLLDGTVEAALTYDFGAFNGVSFIELYRSAPHVILPAGTPLAQQEQISLSSLQDWDMVLLDIPHSREYFLDMLKAAQVDVTIRYSSRSYETVRSLVARGHGFSILNNISKSDTTYDGGRLKAVPIAGDVPALNVCFAHPAEVQPSARSRAVSSTAAALLQAERISPASHHGQ